MPRQANPRMLPSRMRTFARIATLAATLPLFSAALHAQQTQAPSAMQRASGAPNIMVPIANHDDNQHAANENLRLKNLWDGITTMAALIAMQ